MGIEDSPAKDSKKTKLVTKSTVFLILLVVAIGCVASYLSYRGMLRYNLGIDEDLAMHASSLVNSNLKALTGELTLIAADSSTFERILSPSSNALKAPAIRRIKSIFHTVIYNNRDVWTVYLLDGKGTCVLSTAPKIVGKNYYFRPYFREAVSLGEGIYIAEGITVHKLAVYLSKAIRNGQGDTIGVLVFRLSPKGILSRQGDISVSSFFNRETGNSYLCAIVSEDGIFFSTGDNLYSFSPLTKACRDRLSRTRQFPCDSIKSLGLSPTVWEALKKRRRATFTYNHRRFSAWLSPLGSYDIGVLTIARVSLPGFPLWTAPLVFMALFLVLALALGLAYHNYNKMKAEALQNIELERRAREFEVLSRRIIDTANQGVWISDAETKRIIYANAALAEMLGMSLEEILSKACFELLDNEDGRSEECHKHRDADDSKYFEIDVRLKRADGATVPVHINSSTIDTSSGSIQVAFVTDLSEYIELRESVRKLSKAVEGSDVTVVITDINGNIEYVNQAFTETSGYSREEALGKNPRILKSGIQDQAFYEEMWSTILSGGTWRGELGNKRKDGSLYWERSVISPVFGEDGEITHFVAIKQEITQEIELRRELERKAEEINLILDNAGVAIFFAKDRAIVRANRSAAEMLGYESPEELVGKSAYEVYASKEDAESLGREMYSLMSIGERAVTETRFKRRDGTVFWVRLSGRFIVPSDPEQGSIWLAEDVTKERDMREHISKRDEILSTLSEAFSKFVSSHEWKEGCKDLLAALGEVADLDRIIIRRLLLVEGERKLKGEVEGWWARDRLYNQEEDRFEVSLDMPSFEKRRATLERKEPFWVSLSSLLPGEEEILEGWGISSTLVVPIVVFESLWGVISFDHCEEERDFSEFEIEAYKTVASVVAAAIERDLSERRRLVESRKTMALIESSRNVVLRTDPSGNAIFINSFGAEMFGLTERELLRKNIVETIVPGEHRERVEKFLSYIGGGGVPFGSYSFENITAEGGTVWISWSVTPIRDENDELEEILWVGVDIAKQKEIEENLRKATEAKTRFLANMSHEIRTPLNAIIGMVQLLSETGLSQEQARYVSALHSSSKALLSLINDILDLSKIEADEVKIENVPFNLRRVMEELVQTFAYTAKERELDLFYELPVDVPPSLIGDSHKLSQILRNLVGNAIKFTEKGHVLISCQMISQIDNKIELMFKVSDTGIGIPNDKLDMVFKPFVQEDISITRRFGGTGLGLTITKRFVDLMGGKIHLDSKEGIGTTFYITLPFEIDASSPDPYRHRWEAIAEQVEVLVASESDLFRRCLKNMIIGWGIRVKEADVCSKVAEIISSHSPDASLVVLIDEGMLSEDLVIRCREIKEGEAAIVVATWNISRCPWSDKGVSEKVAGCIAKPLTETSVLETLEAVALGRYLKRGRDKKPLLRTSFTSVDLLVVEDVPMNQVLAKTFLEKEGHNVTIASNGLEALRILSEREFQLVLMDVQMPFIDGLTATRIIRACEENRDIDKEISLPPEVKDILESLKERLKGGHIPIVAMTAHAFVEDVHRSLEAGMDAHISKPFELQEVRSTIAKLLGDGGLSSEAEDVAEPSSGDGAYAEGKRESALRVDIKAIKEHLVSSYQFSEDDIVQILETSAVSLEQNMAGARTALERGDFEQLRIHSHTLKGQLANLGLTSLSEIAKEMEMAAKEGDRAFDYIGSIEIIGRSIEPLTSLSDNMSG